MLLQKKSAETIVEERLDGIDFGGDLREGTPKTGRDLAGALASGWFDGNDVIRWMAEMIEADRAQRELDDNDFEERVHEFVVTIGDCAYDEAETVMNALVADENIPLDYTISWRNR